MKKLLFLTLFFFVSDATFAQSKKIDSIYYLLDTLKTPVKDRMWDVGIEGQFRYFTIQCACLDYGLQPTFLYRLDKKASNMEGKEFKNLKTTSLPSLINLAKKWAKIRDKSIAFFMIEPAEKKYILHQVFLIEPHKPEVMY